MAQLYADENFSYRVVQILRTLGHHVLTAQEAGQAQQRIADPEVLAFAVARGRAVITFNRRHFMRLHRTAPAHAGIIVCTRDPNHAAFASRIDVAIKANEPLAGRLLRVNRPG